MTDNPIVRRPEDYPPVAHLFFWWDCMRKLGYPTEAEAEAANEEWAGSGTLPYVCKYGDHWHNGRPHQGRTPRSKTSGPGRLRRQWARQEKKPTPEELAAAYEEATK